MSISNPYYESWYDGNGSTVIFSFAYNSSLESGFDPISANYVKCHIIFSDGTFVVPTFTVDTILSTITISSLTTPDDIILNAPPVGSKVRIYRDVPETQELTPETLKVATTTQITQAFDRIVAMIQEAQSFSKNETLNLDERQRGLLLDYLTSSNDSSILYYDYTSGEIKPTTFPKENIVQSIGGMYLRQVYDTFGNPIFQYTIDGGITWQSILCGDAVNNHENLSGRSLPSQHPASSISTEDEFNVQEKLDIIDDSIIDIEEALDLKANDNAVVHLVGTEIIVGAKSFSEAITATGGFKDADVSVAVKLGDSGNTSANTGNKTIIGAINELEKRTSGGGVAPLPIYLTAVPSSIVGTYNQLNYVLPGTETILNAVVNNNEVLIKTFLYGVALDTTSIPAGNWVFNLFTYVSNTLLSTKIRVEIFKRTSGGTETTLFTATSDYINLSSVGQMKIESFQNAFVVNATDYLGARFYANTTAPINVTTYLYLGDGHPTYITTPLSIRHDLLRDIKYVSDNKSGALHLTNGSDTIYGVKTFNSFPKTPSSAPTTDYQVANKKYVDDNAGGGSSAIPMLTCSTASYDATLTGTVSATYGSTTITGSGTLFTTELAVGNTIVINGTPSLITNIASNTSLTVALGGYTNTTITGATAYKANDNKTVDLTGITVSAGTMISVKFDNKNYGFSLKINGNTVVSSDGGSYAGRYFLPAGYHIRFIRNSTNTAWIIVNEIIYTGSGSTQDYSLRADGWVEQSGFINNLTTTTVNVTLPKTMINIDYKLTHGHYIDSTTAQILYARDLPSTTTIILKSGGSTIARAWWEVKGYAA